MNGTWSWGFNSVRECLERQLTPRKRSKRSYPSSASIFLESLEDRAVPSAATPVGDQFLVNEVLALEESTASVAVLDAENGQSLTVWQSFEQSFEDEALAGQEDASGFGVYAQRFSHDGSPLGDPFRVNTEWLGNQMAPSVASDGQGNFIIAWQGEDLVNGGYDVYYREGVLDGDAIVFSDMGLLAHDAEANGSHAAVAMDASANFVLSWQSLDADPLNGLDVYARTGVHGLSIDDAFRVNDTVLGDQQAPTVAMGLTEDSNVLIAWQAFVEPVVVEAAPDGGGEEEEGGVEIFAKLFTPSDPEPAEFQVNTTIEHDQVAPAAAMNDAGEFVIVWQNEGQQGSGSDIYGARFDAAGDIDDADFMVNTTTQSPQRAPAVGMDEAGNFLVTWQSQHQDGFSWAIIANRYDAVNEDFDGEFTVNNLTVSGPQILPSVAMLPDGTTVVAWLGPRVPEHGEEGEGEEPVEGEGGHVPAVHARVFSEAGAVAATDEFLVATYAALEGSAAAAAMSATGNYALAWESWEDTGDGSSMGIYTRLFNASGEPLTDRMLVNVETFGNQRAPAIAMSADGRFVVAWQSETITTDGEVTTSHYDIFAQRYSAAGEAIGTPFQVNVEALGDQVTPSVGMDERGNFVIVYQSPTEDGTGIFARRFAFDGTPLPLDGQPVDVEVRLDTLLNRLPYAPKIAMNAAGEFAVVWVNDVPEGTNPEPIDTEKSVFARWFDRDGQPIDVEFLVHPGYVKDAQEHPQVAIDELGNFIVAWQSINQESTGPVGTSWGVFARQFHYDRILGVITPVQDEEFLVNETIERPQRFPSVAVDAVGNFVIAWQSIHQEVGDNPSAWGVFQRQYDASGTPLTGEQQVNTWVAGPQILPVIARSTNGDYGIFWDGQGPDHLEGIHGRLYAVPRADHFETSTWVNYSTNTGWSPQLVGDFNGDGKDDVANFLTANGGWYISLSTGTSFLQPLRWVDLANSGFTQHLVGDFNGDGKDDIASFYSPNGVWYVSISTGSSFTNHSWVDLASTGWTTQQVGDFNGDGKDDIASLFKDGRWYVSISDGTKFTNSSWNYVGTGWSRLVVGDFNGDSKDDVAGFASSTGVWYVSLSSGTNFGPSTMWDDVASSWVTQVVGDFNADGMDDIAGLYSGDGRWYVSESSGTSFTTESWGPNAGTSGWTTHVVADFSGDGIDDLAGFRNIDGSWWTSVSTGSSFVYTRWADLVNGGWSSPVTGNFNGDRYADVAGFRTVTGTWHVGLAQPPVSTLTLAGAAVAPTADAGRLMQPELDSVAARAFSIFANLGVDTRAFGGLSFAIADLSGTTLGLAGTNVITIDVNAAGHGWSLGDTLDADDVDLLSVVLHELGHELGLEHGDAEFMADLIGLGDRVLPTVEELDAFLIGN